MASPHVSQSDNHSDTNGATTIPSNVLSLKRKSPVAWTGFTKTSNLVLFGLTAVLFSAFCANHLTHLDGFTWLLPPTEGEKFRFQHTLMHVGMQVHLWSVIPAGILLPLQFLPVMRRRYMNVHKLGGRFLFCLLIIGNISAMSIARNSFGGTTTTQGATATMAVFITIGIYKSWSSIRNLEIDRHRVWVLRTWSWAGSILTIRIILVIMCVSIQKLSPYSYRGLSTCAEIDYIYRNTVFDHNTTDPFRAVYERYPACKNYSGTGEDIYVVVNTNFKGKSTNWGHPEEAAALFNMVFGDCCFLAFILHFALIEVYLSYTKDETERLRKASVARRRAAGFVEKEKSK